MSINLLNPNPYCPKFISYSCQAPSPKATTPILILPVSQLGKCNTKANQISFGIKNLLQKRSENCIYNEYVLCFVYRWWKCTWAWQRSARSLWMAAVSMASIAAEPRRIGKENINYISNIMVGVFMAQCGVWGSLKTHSRSRSRSRSKSSWSRSSKRRSSSSSSRRRSNENKSSGHNSRLIV